MIDIIKKTYNKYNNLSNAVKASVWFTICNILQKGISTITVPIFTRILTAEQYGVYAVYQSWYQIISAFTTLSIYNGIYNNGMIKYEKDKDAFTSAVQTLCFINAFVLLLFYFMNIPMWNNVLDLPTGVVIAMFLELLFSPAFLLWSARQRFEYRYRKLVIITILISILSPLIGIICVLVSTNYKAEARIYAFVVVQMVVGLFFFIYNLRKGKKIYVKSYWKYVISFGIPLIPHYLSQSILNQSDRIMINNMVGSDKAAIYSVAYSVAMLMTLVTSAINNSFVPFSYKKLKDKKYNDIGENANKLICLVGISVVLIISFGPEIIRIFAPIEYYEAIWIIPPVALSVYFMFLYPLFGNIEFYFEEKYFVTIASIFGAVMNVFLNYVCIKKAGYLAAGYTTLVCYIVFSLCHFVFMKKVIKKHISGVKIYDIKFIVVFSIVISAITLIISYMYNYVIVRYVIVLIIIIYLFIKRDMFLNIMKRNKSNESKEI